MRNYSRKFRRNRQRGGIFPFDEETKEQKLANIDKELTTLQEKRTNIEAGVAEPSLLSKIPGFGPSPQREEKKSLMSYIPGFGNSTSEPSTTPTSTLFNGGRRRSRRRRSRRRR